MIQIAKYLTGPHGIDPDEYIKRSADQKANVKAGRMKMRKILTDLHKEVLEIRDDMRKNGEEAKADQVFLEFSKHIKEMFKYLDTLRIH